MSTSARDDGRTLAQVLQTMRGGRWASVLFWTLLVGLALTLGFAGLIEYRLGSEASHRAREWAEGRVERLRAMVSRDAELARLVGLLYGVAVRGTDDRWQFAVAGVLRDSPLTRSVSWLERRSFAHGEGWVPSWRLSHGEVQRVTEREWGSYRRVRGAMSGALRVRMVALALDRTGSVLVFQAVPDLREGVRRSYAYVVSALDLGRALAGLDVDHPPLDVTWLRHATPAPQDGWVVTIGAERWRVGLTPEVVASFRGSNAGAAFVFGAGLLLTLVTAAALAHGRWRTDHAEAAAVELSIATCLLEAETGHRERAEAAASTQARDFRAMVEAAGDAFMEVDRTAVIHGWNKAAERLFGWSAEEAIGRRVDLLLAPPEARRACRRALSGDMMREGEQWRGETEAVRRDGSRLVVEVVTWSTGNTSQRRVYAFMHDVTDKHRAAQELERRRRRYELALTAARAVTYEYDLETRRATFGHEMEDLFGYGPEAFDGRLRPVLACVHPDDVDDLLCALAEQASGHGLPHAFRLLRRDGSWAVAEINVVLVDGRLVGLISDVTERRRTDEALTRFFDLSEDLVVVTDLNGRRRRANAAFERALGRSEARLDALLAPDDPAAGAALLERLARGDRVARQTVRLVRADGSELWVEWDAVPCTTNDEVYAMGRDVSEHMRSQRELEELRRRAEAANRAKSEFLASMSHELRTPLAAVLGYTELAADAGVGEDERTQMLETVLRNGRHLLGILNDLLDLSKIEAGALDVEQIPCSPVRLAQEVVALFEPRAAEKQIDLSLAYDRRVPEVVLTDPLRLRQVLVNLVGNAVKFTERGQVRLRVGMERGMLRFDVEDSGIGIAEEDLPRLFQPFTQADSSTSRRYGGTGLGLALTRRLCTLLGGRVEATSRLGEGSTFSVLLEVVRPDDATAPAEPQVTEAQTGRLPPGTRILLVEDSADVQELLAHILRAAGAEIELAPHGQAACEQVEAAVVAGRPFDLVVMDMQMPVMDGVLATVTLRAAGHRLPIVALTAGGERGDERRCAEAGCDAVLGKPIDRAQLLATLARLLGSIVPVTSQIETHGDEELEQLARQFAGRLPNVIDALTRATRSNTAEARRLAHKLKGSAGSYGYPEVTERVARLERMLVGGAPEAELEGELEALRWLGQRVAAGSDTA